MAQMKADTILMNIWTLICGKEYICIKVLNKWMWGQKPLSPPANAPPDVDHAHLFTKR